MVSGRRKASIPLIRLTYPDQYLHLLLSGCTVTWAHHALLHDNVDFMLGLAITVGLGALALQAYEYHHAFRVHGWYLSIYFLYGYWLSWFSCDYWNIIPAGCLYRGALGHHSKTTFRI